MALLVGSICPSVRRALRWLRHKRSREGIRLGILLGDKKWTELSHVSGRLVRTRNRHRRNAISAKSVHLLDLRDLYQAGIHFGTDPHGIAGSQLAQGLRIRPIGGVGGANRVHSPNGHSPYLLVLYPDRNGSSDWVISMVLPDRHGHLTLEDVRKFLEGSNPEPGLRITEFAISYPLSQREEKPPGARLTERFTKRGVGLIVTPSPF